MNINIHDVYGVTQYVTLKQTHGAARSHSSLMGVYTFRSSDRPVGPTGLSDWSDRESDVAWVVRRSERVNTQVGVSCHTHARQL